MKKLINLSPLWVAIVLLFASCGERNTNNEQRQEDHAVVQEGDLMQPLDTTSTSEEVQMVSASFKTADGTVVDTDDLKGKVVFMNFWATWCPPCRKEMPSIQTLYNQFKNSKDIVFLLVEIENDMEGAKKFLVNENLSLPIAYPVDHIPEQWLGQSIPSTVILGKDGKIAAKQEGMYDFSAAPLVEFVQKLVDQ